MAYSAVRKSINRHTVSKKQPQKHMNSSSENTAESRKDIIVPIQSATDAAIHGKNTSQWDLVQNRGVSAFP